MAKVKNCEWCGAEFEDKHRDGKRFCGKSCSAKYRNQKCGNPTTGKTGESNPNWKGGTIRQCRGCGKDFHDSHYEGRVFCSRSCAGSHNARRRHPVQRKDDPKRCIICGKSFITKRDSARYCSAQCYFKDEKVAIRRGIPHKGKKLSEHIKQAISIANSARNAEFVYTHGRNGHHDSPKAGNIFYRSSYEQLAYQLLDNDATVTHYQPEPFVIEYTNQDGNTRRYRPDILVGKEGQTILVEVKPQWKLSDPTTQLKIEAGERYAAQKGWVFEVWTEKELGI